MRRAFQSVSGKNLDNQFVIGIISFVVLLFWWFLSFDFQCFSVVQSMARSGKNGMTLRDLNGPAFFCSSANLISQDMVKKERKCGPKGLFKSCVRYIFASLFCMSKREHLRNKKKCFLFHFKSSSCSWDNQLLTF